MKRRTKGLLMAGVLFLVGVVAAPKVKPWLDKVTGKGGSTPQ